MPTYTYKREDGSVFETDQRITEDALAICPTTGQKVKRIISGGAGLVFKGTGFYQTDYGKTGESNGSGADKSESGSATSKDTESSSKESAAESKSTSTADASTSDD